MASLKSIFKPSNYDSPQTRGTLIRLVIIASVLLLSALLVPLAVIGISKTRWILYAILALCLGMILLHVYHRWPVLIIIGVMAGGMFIPFAGPSGLNISIIGLACLLGLWIVEIVVERKFKIVQSRTMLPLFLFILVSFFAFGIGQLPWFIFAQHAPLTAQLGGLAIVVFSLVAFLLTANLITDIRWLQILTWVFLALGGFYVLGRMIKWGGIDILYHGGFTAGSMFWTWLIAIAFSQAFFNHHLRLRWRMLLGILVLGTLYIAVIKSYDWKSGWFPGLVAIGAMLSFRYLKAALISTPFWLVPGYFIANKAVGTDEYSWGTRLDAWAIVTEIAKSNPITGLGFANYYWYTPLFRIRGYAVRFNSHSQYVDLIAEVGLLGLAIFFWLFWEIGKAGWDLRKKVPDGFALAYVYGALGGLVGTLVAGKIGYPRSANTIVQILGKPGSP